ncbi:MULTISPECIES: hypothetical protein [unclassified Sinorhizobium]|uniref:hypothetical protein n=1 Tax=unclassified Sinorhizobium TaxID=2613772 RepID=UPI0024C345F8|nr:MULTISPECIES: hypothetical protein [unclassified Sinorhizobium]MDK1376153.1 hypothetical protein [Sinorhizobium sp. 6-70]MDK1480310.1 hypothetical protein [Sinorhizobium sp. 6-117]
MQFSSKILDTYFAPYISELQSAIVPEIPAAVDQRLSFAFNHELGAKRFKRIAHLATIGAAMSHHVTSNRAYLSAREGVHAYLAALPEHNQLHSLTKAISHFETCILHCHISALCLHNIHVALDQNADARIYNDPDYEKLRILNNRIKHFDEDLRKGLSGETPVQTYAIWLTETEIRCRDDGVTYSDLARILVEHDQYLRYLASDFFELGH